jgi:hypothetical protein
LRLAKLNHVVGRGKGVGFENAKKIPAFAVQTRPGSSPNSASNDVTKMKQSIKLTLVAPVVLAVALSAYSQSASEDLSFFGQLGQGNAMVTGTQALRDNACVPTSVANGLTFLENYANFTLDEPSPFTASPNNYTAVNNLIAAMDTDEQGTAYSDKYNGLQTYLSATGANPAPRVSVMGQASPASKGGVPAVNPGINLQGVNPTVSYLVTALDNHDAVELGLQWGSFTGDVFSPDGGHSVTLDSISYTASSNSGMLGIIDPWGANTTANNASSSAGDYEVPFSITNGFMYLTYPLTVADNPADVVPGSNAPTEAGFVIGSGQTARVLNDVVESVPDSGSTIVLMGASLLLMAVLHRGLPRRLARPHM